MASGLPKGANQRRVGSLDSNDAKAESSLSSYEEVIVHGKRCLSCWTFVRGIGIGQFGSVVVVQPKKDAITYQTEDGSKSDLAPAYAMKCIGKYAVIAKEAIHRTIQELRILSEICHPFVLEAFAAFQDESNLYLISELCEGGNLESILSKHHKLSIAVTKVLIGQLLLALDCVHSLGMVHMDVKPENCLLDKKGNIKLSDFNAATKINPSGKTTSRKGVVGTPGYMAPEILTGEEFVGGSPDFWGLGVCVYRLIHGQHSWPFPFQSHQGVLMKREEMVESIRKIGEPSFDKTLKHEGIKEIKEDPFFKGMNWDDLIARKISPGLDPVDSFSDVDDKITMTKWAFEQLAITQEKKAQLSDTQQLHFKEWQYTRFNFNGQERETQLDRLMTMKPEEMKKHIGESSVQDVEALMCQIRLLKRQWLDDNCKLSLSEFVNYNLRVQNAQLEDQITGLTKELHLATRTIINLKRSLLETSSLGHPLNSEGINRLNPLGPIVRTRSASQDTEPRQGPGCGTSTTNTRASKPQSRTWFARSNS
ncbi:hypothetical protein AAMO2058_000249800 [Amorphochlora amoebiformis]